MKKISDQQLEQIIRVDHAGEFGAKRIYEGQLAFLKNKQAIENVNYMKQQELKHLAYFENELVRRKIRPTVMYPIWNMAGFALGAVTAMMGEKAAYACTVAVEEVIEEHYQNQLNALSDFDETELKNEIEKFKAEETEHKKISLDNEAENAAMYEVLSTVIKGISRTAIWISKRV